MVESTISLEQLADEPASHGGCGSCGSGIAAGKSSSCGNGLEKIYPTTAVRFGYMRYIGEFSHVPDLKFTCGAKVVIQTKRGIEIGEQVSLTCGGCDKSVTRDQMREWVEASGEDAYIFEAGRILREATAADLAENARILIGARVKRRFCQQLADVGKLPLRIVECEILFGGERILFFFTAAERIDFRAMVKELAHEYRTRIEMRQIGARDEARLLADFETCGREVCCKVFLKTLRPISMRMAKVQKATLDPSQVSGRCGRLKCCLRYEHVGYEELDRTLPRIGVRIRTNHGEGVVVNRQILTQLVQIRGADDRLTTVVAEDITEVGVPEPPPRVEPAGSVDSRRRQRSPQKPRRQPVHERADRMKLVDQVAPTTDNDPDAPGPPDTDKNLTPPEPVGDEGGAEKVGERPVEETDDTQPRRRRRRGRRRRGRRGGPSESGTTDAPPPS